MSVAAVIPPPACRPTGRPRRLTIEAILDMAEAIGLDGLEMGRLAERLGVGVATLYGYVRGREHLLALLADRLGRRRKVVDRGQDWPELLREHAACAFAAYLATPQLIARTLAGQLGSLADARYTDDILGMLLDRGLAPSEAIDMFFEVNQAVIGAVVGQAYRRELTATLGGEGADIPRLLAVCEAEALDSLGRCVAANGLGRRLGDYRPTLERIIAARQAAHAGDARPGIKQS